MLKTISSLHKLFNIRTSLQVTLPVLRGRFNKRETLRSLRINSVKETFELRKLEFLTRPPERSYPRKLAENILTEVKFSSWKKELQNKSVQKCFAFHHDFEPSHSWLKKGSHEILQLRAIDSAIVAYGKDKSVKDFLVRAKIPSDI